MVMVTLDDVVMMPEADISSDQRPARFHANALALPTVIM